MKRRGNPSWRNALAAVAATVLSQLRLQMTKRFDRSCNRRDEEHAAEAAEHWPFLIAATSR